MSNTTYTLSQNDSASYEDGYKIFLQRSDFREKVLEKFIELLPRILSNINAFNVLDVGCGNGVMTQKYLRAIKAIAPEIKLTILEPAHNSLAEAEKLLKPEVHSLLTVSKLPNVAFDLIIASYVFYHLSPESLVQFANQLAPGGTFAIMMGTNDHPLKMHPKLKATSNHGSSDKLTPFLDSLKETAKFTISRHRVETRLRLDGLWFKETFSEEAQRLLSFSLNKNFCDLKEPAMEALNEIFGEALVAGNNTLKSIHEIILIEKAL